MNQIQNLKSSKQWKFVNDKAKAALATLDDTKTAVIKAVNHDVRPPKEKHVQKLLYLLQVPNAKPAEIVDLLIWKIHRTQDWIVALKCLQVFHRLIQDGNENFARTCVQKNPVKVLNIKDFKDPNPSPKVFIQVPFIRNYSGYLEQRLFLFKNTGIRTLSPKYIYPTEMKDIFEVIESLQLLLDEILNCTLKQDLVSNSSTMNAVSMVLKDSMLCYKLLSDGVLKLIDAFFKLGSEQANKGLEIYQKHLKQTDSLIEFYEEAKKLSGIIGSKLPSLKPPPDTFLKQMKSYVSNPESFEEEDKEENHNKHESAPLSSLLGFDKENGEVNFDDIFESNKEEEQSSPENSANTKSNPGNDFETSNDFESDPFGTNNDPFSSDPFSENEPKPQEQKIESNKKKINLDDLFGSSGMSQPQQPTFSPTPQQFTPTPKPVYTPQLQYNQPQYNNTNPFNQPFNQPQRVMQTTNTIPQPFNFNEPPPQKKEETHAFDFLTDITKDTPKQNNQGSFGNQQGSFGNNQSFNQQQTQQQGSFGNQQGSFSQQQQQQTQQQGSFGNNQSFNQQPQQQGFDNDPFMDNDPFAQNNNDGFGNDPFF
eukprot:gene1801-943_t